MLYAWDFLFKFTVAKNLYMRKFILSVYLLLVSLPFSLKAQTFTTAHDTTWLTFSGQLGMDSHNDITVPAGGDPITLHWKVVSENFSQDPEWCGVANLGICDNYSCISNGGGDLLGGALFTNSPNVYHPDSTDIFKGSFDLDTANPGHHYITINLRDSATGYNKDITFMVYKWPASAGSITKVADMISLYPNPASDELNVIYNDLPVKTIAVYNIIGKTMSLYRTSGNSAKLDLHKIPAGVYFLRMADAKGDIVATRRFTKQ